MASIFSDQKQLQALANSCESITEMLRQAEMCVTGGNAQTVKKWAKVYGVVLPTYVPRNNGFVPKNKKSYEEIFCENSVTTRANIKILIKREHLIPWICATQGCGLVDTWLEKPLVLQLEHKNGIRNDNRLENLELLCPNCHTQTATYAGKKSLTVCTFVECERKIRATRKYCDSHIREARQQNMRIIGRKISKIVWPSVESVLDRLETESYTSIGESLGVSDNAVRKYLKKNNVTPPRKWHN